MVARKAQRQSLVWAGMIIFPTPSPRSSFLSPQVDRRRIQSLCLVNPMHWLMRPVLLRMARLDKLNAKASLDPPSAQAGQSQGSGGTQGRPIIGSDDPGNSVFPENALKGQTRRRHRLLGH
jgi:hypothetical protein